MDIDRVRYFQTVAETGSLVRAAEVLHISQPALSKAVKRLEAEVGVKLFEPDGRGLRLTAAGQRFRLESAPLLAQWLALPSGLQNSESSARPVRMGSFEVFSTYFLSHLLRTVPMDALELHELGPGKLELTIAEGVIDFGITYVPVPRSGVEFLEVGRIRMNTYGLPAFARTAFPERPFVVPLAPLAGAPSKVVGLDGWPDHRYARKIAYRVTLMESALELCREGLCVGYFPSFVVELHNAKLRPEFRLRTLSDPLPAKERQQSVYLVLPKGGPELPLHRKIAKSLRELV